MNQTPIVKASFMYSTSILCYLTGSYLHMYSQFALLMFITINAGGDQ